jgi:hypothetical protein
MLAGQFIEFLDPRGNLIEIVGYDNIQFTPNVLRNMGLSCRPRSIRGRPARFRDFQRQ